MKKSKSSGLILGLTAVFYAARSIAFGAIVVETTNVFTFTPAGGNLIAGLSPSAVVNASAGVESSGPVTKLTDGSTSNVKAEAYTIGNNGFLTYALGDSANGYDISGVNIFSGWVDQGRDKANISGLAYSTAFDPDTFIAIPGTSATQDGASPDFRAMVRYTDSAGTIASQAHSLRISFGTQENGYAGYHEIEIIGVEANTGSPKVEVCPATEVKLTTATINGGIVSTGISQTAVIAYWGTSDGGMDVQSWANTNQLGIATQEPQNFSLPLTGLAMGTTYYYRFAATNDYGLVFAPSSASFTTLPSEPLVANGTATSVVDTSATISGTVAYVGAPPTTLYAFWATNDCGTEASSWIANGGSVDLGRTAEGAETSAALSGLTPNTVYYYNFMASNAYAMAWGSTDAAPSFRTAGVPSLSGVTADLVMDNSARLNATLANGNEARVYFTWGLAADALVNTNDLGILPMGGYSVNLAGLSPTTMYYFQAHTENAYGSENSAVISFSTIGVVEQWTSVASGMWTNPATWNVPGAPRAGAVVTINSAVTLNAATPELASVTVNSGKTLAFDGWDTVLNATDVVVNGMLAHVVNTATSTNGLGLWIPNARVKIMCGNLTVGSTGTIDVSGKGFLGGVLGSPVGKGPGGGGTAYTGAGGGYGGVGGTRKANAIGGRTYGSSSEPLLPGSGGGMGTWTNMKGGEGGGAVFIDASGQVSVVGAITANGGDGSGGAAGGGSGGSVYIHCGTFSGTGSIKANGNPAVFAGQGTGNGGGGRIAVVFTNLAAQAALSPTVAFDLGRGPVGSPGVGTLYFNSPAFYPSTTVAGSWALTIPGFTEWRPDSFTLNSGTVQFPAGFTFEPAVLTVAAGSELLLNNDVVLSCGSLSVGGSLKMQYPFSHSGDITLSGGLIDVATNPVSGTATFACTGNLVLTNGGRMHFNVGPTNATMPDCGALITIGDSLNVHSNSSLYAYSGNSLYGSPRFSVGGNFNLAATGKVVADGFGLVQGTGPGAGGLGTYGGGGGHGGAGAGGGGDSRGAGGITNGIALAPYAGSGGGRSNWVGYGGNGGGSLKMAIIGDAIVNGAISANGNPGDSCGGGGAGGGIFITCRKFLGSGSLSAKGGKGGTAGKGGGGGGGGCIAVWLNVPETEVARILAGDRKNVAVTSTTPTFTGTLAVDKGENGQAAIVPQAAPGIVSFVKIIPPAVTVIAIR